MLRTLLFLTCLLAGAANAAPLVHAAPALGDFALATRAGAARIVYSSSDAAVVGHAARDLAADIERVTGQRPALGSAAEGAPAVLVGTLGTSAVADALAASGKVDVAKLRGAWESFVIATVEHPLPGVPRALAIIGSDPRGTAYGVYELSQAIGVSPWYWWADVAPAHKDALYVAAGTRRFGPPSVKYRGIFINDEDWGLQQWAARTLEPGHGGIGPKTYEKMFELLLRLKANTLWPAMHPGTPPFNSFPENARLANEYAIVMGSSHAEPMLRNNVGEWKDDPHAYNYQTNRDGVLKYWEDRVAANGRYENIYTIGMRGIHDSAMQGPKSDSERARLLENIFDDQRALLAKYVNRHPEQVPQVFVPYKEVLGQYRNGLKVPDDVTVMWTDDNFGYLRNFTTPAERARAGGFGVYYHLSYLGAPLSYIWLSTTPPALVWEEMTRAYDTGAQRIWIANVGDLKPAEIDTEFFLRLAWDVKQWNAQDLPRFLVEWAAREFGPEHAHEIAAIMDDYHRLNFDRRPEHLQWWLPKQPPRRSTLGDEEASKRLQAFRQLRERVEALQAKIAERSQDAWFELVAYPVTASALANERFFEGERGNQAAALAADARLDKLTAWYNDGLAGGKWRHIMSQEPADRQWPSLRLSKWTMPSYPPRAETPPAPRLVIEAAQFDCQRAGAAASWEVIPGLGHGEQGAVALAPASSMPVSAAHIAVDAARLDYHVKLPFVGDLPLEVHLIPTHGDGATLRLAVAIDDGAPQVLTLPVNDGRPDWAQGVLDNERVVKMSLSIHTVGEHTISVYGTDPGVVIDRIVLDGAAVRVASRGSR
ncbi:glycosyl hydrolase 115 family protein [Massilia terrae]|uniref:Glycosyl hydrolase 115 family protein n=1 Tax=Massilia terrae TaxID=1811224 RepID=A0ABT2CTE2_9BURK|nr:glycosyl hydrolase 115 family protein [Massilia terrae]MCS0657219.1 glycosyl hydrolase 115 family protein [Massilia terrae]